MEKREITYLLTKQEFIKLAFAQRMRNRYGAITLLFFLLAFIICYQDHHWYIAVLFILASPFIYYWRLGRFYDERVKPETISISPEGLAVKSDGDDLTMTWKRFESCKETHKYIHVRFKRKGAFAIPKRVFSSEAEAKAFYHELQTYIGEGQQ